MGRYQNVGSAFMRQHYLYKMFMVLVVTMVTLACVILSTALQQTNPKQCYLKNGINEKNDDLDTAVTGAAAASNITFLDDVLNSSRRPRLGNTIFFHETSCLNGLVRLNARQACAIESAARINPELDTFLLFASPVGFLNNAPTNPIIAALQSYSNVFMRNVNLRTYAFQTPAEDWIHNDDLFHSIYVSSHVSDFLRFLSLYKWGGTYLDLDVILKHSIRDLPPNFLGAESNDTVAAGVINVDVVNTGHQVAEIFLKEFVATFNGDKWGNNGPGVVTRTMYKLCQTSNTKLMTRKKCNGIRVYPITSFYAIEWRQWRYFFDEKLGPYTMNLTNNSLAIHVWNKHSSQEVLRVGSRAAYALLAEKYCPKVYSSCGDFF